MDPLAILGIIFFLAFLVETLVEAIAAPVYDHFPKLAPYKWTQRFLALAVGIGGAFVYRFDLLYLLGLWMKQEIPLTPYGITITGLAIGMGAGYLHDAIQKFLAPKPSLPTSPSDLTTP